MAFKKGEARPAKSGRKKGTPNHTTTQTREAIAALVDGRVDKLGKWLDAVAKRDPETAFKLFVSLLEYSIPKLARMEATVNGGTPLTSSPLASFCIFPDGGPGVLPNDPIEAAQIYKKIMG